MAFMKMSRATLSVFMIIFLSVSAAFAELEVIYEGHEGRITRPTDEFSILVPSAMTLDVIKNPSFLFDPSATNLADVLRSRPTDGLNSVSVPTVSASCYFLGIPRSCDFRFANVVGGVLGHLDGFLGGQGPRCRIWEIPRAVGYIESGLAFEGYTTIQANTRLKILEQINGKSANYQSVLLRAQVINQNQRDQRRHLGVFCSSNNTSVPPLTLVHAGFGNYLQILPQK